MSDLYLFFYVLDLLGRGVSTSPKQLADKTGCTLYRARKIFAEMRRYVWIYRVGNTYRFNTESTLTFAVLDAIHAWDIPESEKA